MKLNKIKKYIIISLVIFEVCIIHLAYKSFNNKPIELDNVKLREIVEEKKNTYAVMISDGNGGYTESNEDKFPTEGYRLNLSKSGCIDNNGNKIENVLSYQDNKVLVSTGETTYCYLYFDEKGKTGEDIVNNPIPDVLESTGVAEDELAVRYYGTNPPNYICFGTKDKNECLNNEDKHMYRIIGITKQNRLKLIKKEALPETIQWWSTNTENIEWPQSIIYNEIIGNKFLNNPTYVPNTTWREKIENVLWKYGDINVLRDISNIIKNEQKLENTVLAQVGLMYASDYMYAYQKSGLDCSPSGGMYETCKTSWLHISNNDSTNLSNNEWIILRLGDTGGNFYYSDYINSNGTMNGLPIVNSFPVRPVFYLIPTIELSGSGSQSDPFIITS